MVLGESRALGWTRPLPPAALPTLGDRLYGRRNRGVDAFQKRWLLLENAGVVFVQVWWDQLIRRRLPSKTQSLRVRRRRGPATLLEEEGGTENHQPLSGSRGGEEET